MDKVLLIATTKLQKDGLTEIIKRIARAASSRMQIGIALAEGCEGETRKELLQYAKLYVLPSRKRALPMYLVSLSNLVRKEKYSVVHIHGNSATMFFDLFAAWLGGATIRITHVHNCAHQSKIKQRTLGYLLNCLVTHPVACSRTSGEMLYNKPFRVMTNGINCKQFAFSVVERNRMRKKLGIEDAFVVGHVGRFSPQKNQIQLIHIFRELLYLQPNAVMLLCGDGDDINKCQQEVRRLNIERQVLFCGKVENPSGYYQAMDVFVLPSLFEGLPLVGVEAQASGLPCIFSDTITSEAKLIPQTMFLPLKAANSVWAAAIKNIRLPVREEAANWVNSAGYTEQALEKQLRDLYEEVEG